MMFGAILKSYYAQTHNLDPRKDHGRFHHAVHCEEGGGRPSGNAQGWRSGCGRGPDDEELGRLIKMYGINFENLPDEDFDQDMFGQYSGAGVIFGASGGVMEAALRTVKETLENKPLDSLDFTVVRGMEGVKTAELEVAGMQVKVAVASSMSCAKPLLDEIRAGTSPYHFIEIMGCPAAASTAAVSRLSTLRSATALSRLTGRRNGQRRYMMRMRYRACVNRMRTRRSSRCMINS